jgi:hypothetical protein
MCSYTAIYPLSLCLNPINRPQLNLLAIQRLECIDDDSKGYGKAVATSSNEQKIITQFGFEQLADDRGAGNCVLGME